MDKKLLPCPFCGGEATQSVKNMHGVCQVFCKTEGCHASTKWSKDPVPAWNRRAGGWIPVEERLPEEGQTILVWYKDGGFGMTVNVFDEMENVTHWMPLPLPPKEAAPCSQK